MQQQKTALWYTTVSTVLRMPLVKQTKKIQEIRIAHQLLTLMLDSGASCLQV